ncbi:MAG: hypothetical protein ACE5EF_10415 [Dehalococcoidia bacterium]
MIGEGAEAPAHQQPEFPPFTRRGTPAQPGVARSSPEYDDGDRAEPHPLPPDEAEAYASSPEEEDAPRHQAPVPEAPRRVRYGRYEPLETVPVKRPLPSIYRRHRVLGLWYIPAALLLGAAVAVGVVLAVDYFAGDGSGAPAGLSTATLPPATGTAVSGTIAVTPSPSVPPPSSTPATIAATPSPSITPLPGQFLFGPGDRVVIVGTGDCLNVRDAPSTSGVRLSCIGDGVEATILSGPAEGDGYKWWHVRAAGVAEGWVVEDYLSRAP